MCGYFGTDPLLLPPKPKYEAHYDPAIKPEDRTRTNSETNADHAYRVGSGECGRCRKLGWINEDSSN